MLRRRIVDSDSEESDSENLTIDKEGKDRKQV